MLAYNMISSAQWLMSRTPFEESAFNYAPYYFFANGLFFFC